MLIQLDLHLESERSVFPFRADWLMLLKFLYALFWNNKGETKLQHLTLCLSIIHILPLPLVEHDGHTVCTFGTHVSWSDTPTPIWHI